MTSRRSRRGRLSGNDFSPAMTPDIISKLSHELNLGITTELQVVYLLVGIRKIMEQNDEQNIYKHLNFHCNWVLHSRLRGPDAQDVLQIFEKVHLELRTGTPSDQLPTEAERKLLEIIKMDLFKEELDLFMQRYGLPSLNLHRGDGWVHFLHLYASVIKDIPLMIKPDADSYIKKVTVDINFANEVKRNQMLFRVVWTTEDKEGISGSQEIYNSFFLERPQV
jgi:hypothetical protein